MRLVDWGFLALLFFAAPVSAQRAGEAVSQADLASLDREMRSELQSLKIPGAVLAIVHGDKVVLARGYGVANVETGVRVDADTLFRVASTTKMITALTVAASADAGVVGLQEPVSTYLRGLPGTLGRASLHQLLTHTAGLRDETVYFGPHDDDALGAFVGSWTSSKLLTQPGDVYSYSNIGYGLAARVLEKASDLHFAAIVRNRVFTPLGMSRTTFRPLEAMTYSFSQGHDLDKAENVVVVRPYADNSRYWANGGMITSANDFARFAVALLNGGAIDGRQAISPGVVARMYGAYAPVPSSGAPSYYGYGFNVRTISGLRAYQHGGERIGFGSLVRLIPERRVGVIILANRTAGLPLAAFEKATKIALALPRLGPSALPQLPPAGPSVVGTPAAAPSDPASLVGRYVNNEELAVDLILNDGKFAMVGTSGEPVPVTSADGKYSAGGQAFTFARGTRSGRLFLFIAGHALSRELQSARSSRRLRRTAGR